MDDLKCITTIIEIARIAHLAYEALKAYEEYEADEENENAKDQQPPEPAAEDGADETDSACRATAKKQKRTKGPRIISITHEEKEYVQTWINILKEKNEKNFYKAIRMSVVNFQVLLSQLKEKLLRHSQRKPIDPETRLAITLLYLAQGCRVKVIAWGFHLGISTVHKIIYETCDAILDELHDVYLVPPSSNELETVSDKFYTKTGLPNCIGALGGKHIDITGSRNNGPLTSNYKNSCGVVLLAACDANYIFRFADCVILRSKHDSDALTRSNFIQNLLNGSLEVFGDNNLPGTSNTFQHYFVADSSFPLKKHLMRPFPGHQLTQDKENFNSILSKAQLHIENSFGILANHWRVLPTRIQSCPKNAPRIVLATVLLHNFLMLKDDRNYFHQNLVDQTINSKDIPGQWRNDIKPLKSYLPRYANRSSTKATESRDILKDFLQTKYI